jgi:hypothetical protein
MSIDIITFLNISPSSLNVNFLNEENWFYSSPSHGRLGLFDMNPLFDDETIVGKFLQGANSPLGGFILAPSENSIPYCTPEG